MQGNQDQDTHFLLSYRIWIRGLCLTIDTHTIGVICCNLRPKKNLRLRKGSRDVRIHYRRFPNSPKPKNSDFAMNLRRVIAGFAGAHFFSVVVSWED